MFKQYMNSTRERKTRSSAEKLFHEGAENVGGEGPLIGSCLWDHFTVAILPDDTASILPSFKDTTLICGIVEVILSPPPLPVFSG